MRAAWPSELLILAWTRISAEQEQSRTSHCTMARLRQAHLARVSQHLRPRLANCDLRPPYAGCQAEFFACRQEAALPEQQQQAVKSKKHKLLRAKAAFREAQATKAKLANLSPQEQLHFLCEDFASCTNASFVETAVLSGDLPQKPLAKLLRPGSAVQLPQT